MTKKKITFSKIKIFYSRKMLQKMAEGAKNPPPPRPPGFHPLYIYNISYSSILVDLTSYMTSERRRTYILKIDQHQEKTSNTFWVPYPNREICR